MKIGAALLVMVALGDRCPAADIPLGSSFTYQGQLKLDGQPVDGAATFSFSLWDADAGGNRLASPLVYANVPVVNGLFSVNLDFGAGAFNGDARWLEVEAESPPGSGSGAVLSPRQRMAPVPYALALSDLRTIPNGTSPNILAGWRGNWIFASAVGATLSGGGSPLGGGSPRPNIVHDNYGTVSGGSGNKAGTNDGDVTNGDHATVSGGYANEASASVSTIGGGWGNRASGARATVSGGWNNNASGTASTVGGGRDNVASGENSVVAGGFGNHTTNWGAMVLGGVDSRAQGVASLAAGRRAVAAHHGSFVWADYNDADFTTTGQNQFLVRAAGGVGINTAAPKTTLDVEGLARVKGANWPSAGEGMELGYDSTLNRGYVQVYDRTAPGTWGSLYLGNGNVGIGSLGTSKLTVAGTIESTTGGVKYPDGTTQTTATIAGPAGPAGYHCWDLNMNRINDPLEDMNHDGAFNIIDCQGAQGLTGPAGPPGPPTTTSAICIGAAQLPNPGYCNGICTGTVVAEVRVRECTITSDTGSCSSPSNYSYGVCCVCAP
ncbi:MAG: hypothetical protein V1790_13015 [Planctomycetota bacterium]